MRKTEKQAHTTGTDSNATAKLHHARELLDTLTTEIQDLYAVAPGATIRGNLHADALLCGIGHVIENAARGGTSRAAGIEEALCLLTELRDGLPKPPGEHAAMWHRANGLVSGICAALNEAGQEAQEGTPGPEATQPPGAPGIGASAFASQGMEAFDKGAARAEDRRERAALACKAACEAHSLAALVGKAIEDDDSNEGTRDAMHSMLLRIQRLSCCVLSALDDDVATVDDVREQMSAA